MKRIHSLFALAVMLTVTPLLAADLGKYENWNESPAGYYMTRAEREQWSKLTNEAEAAKFVEDFLAKRDPGFSAEVKKRAEMADKYLAVGKTPASKTLRGKVIILFGPPSGVNVTERIDKDVKRDSPAMADVHSNAGSFGGGGKSDDSANYGGSISTSRGVRVYSITFTGDFVAKTLDRKDVTFIIDADQTTGKDRIASRAAAKDAEEYFERVAQASIKK